MGVTGLVLLTLSSSAVDPERTFEFGATHLQRVNSRPVVRTTRYFLDLHILARCIEI
jgi:hypothetical protein